MEKPVTAESYTETVRKFYETHASFYEVHSDGGARPNPGSGGYGFIVVSPDGRILEEGYGAVPNATNNQMELKGAIEGFRLVPADGAAVFLTDNKLVYTGFAWNLDKDPRPRFIKWEEKNWKNVKNLDLVQELYELGKKHHAECIPRPLNAKGTDYARMGHEEHGAAKLSDGKWEFPYNKICDKLAEYGETDARLGRTGQVSLIENGRQIDRRALYVTDRDAWGHGRVVSSDGREISVN